jgi:hypothetical protein
MDKFHSFREFLLYIENNYEEEQQIIVEEFMAYYINEYRGFGKCNCEYTYNDNLKHDKNGELHNLALIGFEFEKKYINKSKK